jgi:uncharacterized integral membrane protein
MIRRFLRALVMIPAAAVLVGLAIANRQPVTVSFNPFDSSDADLAVSVPLYVAGFMVLIAGVMIGGFAAWLEQGKHRRTGSRLAAELVTIRTELAHLKGRMVRPQGRSPTEPGDKRLPAA